MKNQIKRKGMREGENGRELRLSSFSFPWSMALRHQSLAFCARLYAKYEAPEEKAGLRIISLIAVYALLKGEIAK